jgi:TPR repeat protein
MSAYDLVLAGHREEGLRQLSDLAAQGYAPAQVMLGQLYLGALGVPEDLPRAMALIRSSAAQNFRPAVEMLARLERADQARLAAAGGSGAAASQPPSASSPPLASRRERLVHNPALEATHCVHIRAHGAPGSRGFTQSIVNECGQVVEVSWCATGGECEREGGNGWALEASGPGSAYPVGSGAVRYGACLGRNSGGFAQGSQGQRMICTGEAGH